MALKTKMKDSLNVCLHISEKGFYLVIFNLLKVHIDHTFCL